MSRRRSRLATAALATGVLLESARRARGREVSGHEEQVFRVVNRAPDALHIPVWAVMQSGSLGSVFATAGILRWRNRDCAAAGGLVAGTAVWGGVKAVKPSCGRGRPAHHLEEVAVRGPAQTGLGYPSGHAAVAMALALIATRSDRAAVRSAAIGAAGITGAARMFVGAHLPLDIAGGFAIGTLAGMAANAVTDRWCPARL